MNHTNEQELTLLDAIVYQAAGDNDVLANTIKHNIQAHTNAEIAKVLDRLESQAESVTERMDSPLYVGDTRVDYRTHKMISPRAIQAERAKLKEVNRNEQC